MRNILLISKEILRPEYLSCYGGTLYKTPNIDSLADNGTIFTNFYTAAPSSAMGYTAMFTGLNLFETKRKVYREVSRFDQCPTLSEELETKGYDVHVIWASKWFRTSHKMSRVFSDKAIFHNLDGILQQIGSHYQKGNKVRPNKDAQPIATIYNEVKKIFETSQKRVFVWIHCPHVLAGRMGYGSDIDVFDHLVGRLFDFFRKEEIYFTADHGHMDCERGIPVYGFHVYEPAIKIPLITPNHYGQKVVSDVLSNVQLKKIILEQRFEKQEFIYSDTQYYLQENRKLMIRKGDYKYIYNKKNHSEELYDLKFDPKENVNLLIDNWIDRNRHKFYFLEEVHYYPRWDEAEKAYIELKKEKDRIWRKGKFLEEIVFRINNRRKKGFANLNRYLIYKKTKFKGRWDSAARVRHYEI